MRFVGQAAMEYLIVVGLVLAFIIPIWAYVSSVQQQAGQQLSITYAKNTAQKLASTADLVFSQGPPAKVRVNVFIPKNIESVSVAGNTINLRMYVDSTISDVFATATANVSGTLPTSEGNYFIIVEAKDGYVQISPE